jgi:hypothetical protein
MELLSMTREEQQEYEPIWSPPEYSLTNQLTDIQASVDSKQMYVLVLFFSEA